MTLTSPSMDNSSAELLPSGDSPLNRRMTESLLASLSEHERAAILSVPAAQNPEDLRMFARWGGAPCGERRAAGLLPACGATPGPPSEAACHVILVGLGRDRPRKLGLGAGWGLRSAHHG